MATFTFTLPPSMRGKSDGFVVVKDLTAAEEIDAAKDSKENGDTRLSLLHALAKRHLVSWCGEKASWEDGKIDELWARIGRRGRRLMIDAINAAFYDDDGEELKDFLASRTET